MSLVLRLLRKFLFTNPLVIASSRKLLQKPSHYSHFGQYALHLRGNIALESLKVACLFFCILTSTCVSHPTMCNFWTWLSKVLRTWCAKHFDSEVCFRPQWHTTVLRTWCFLHLWTSKCAWRIFASYGLHFMCFALPRRARFPFFVWQYGCAAAAFRRVSEPILTLRSPWTLEKTLPFSTLWLIRAPWSSSSFVFAFPMSLFFPLFDS